MTTDMTISPSVSGTSLRTELNEIIPLLGSLSPAITRPAYVTAGWFWVLDPGTATKTVNYYDGTDDIIIGTINTTANTFTPYVAGDVIGSTYASIASVVGKQTVSIPAAALTPRSANGCASLTKVNGASNQPDIPYLAFDGAAAEYAGFFVWMPKGWNEGTVTAQFAWRRASGTGAANVVWGLRAVAVGNSDSPAAAFGTGATVTAAADTTTGDFAFSAETGACTIAGSPAENDLVFFEVYRDGASGSDTLDGVDAWLTAVRLFYTTNAATDA